MALPTIRNIPLVSVSVLPDRLRAIFPFPLFNAVQSQCFHAIYQTSDNFVLSSPTGSGKTVILELAICQLLLQSPRLDFKIIYVAPTKSLCSERARDWICKFSSTGLKCIEFTGDCRHIVIRSVQEAHIIVTTPEKWDSVTRKWKDHRRLMEMVKLFLIDETHLLKDDRGAGLETLVSRMKSVGSDVRFIALSATIPNISDVATWLGKSRAEPTLSAPHEAFDDSFRPVKLEKHVYGYSCPNSNSFAFEKTLQSNLYPLLQRHSQRRPILIFNTTKKTSVDTAEFLAHTWRNSSENTRPWDAPNGTAITSDPSLNECVVCGVAYHHSGLNQNDRLAIETAYKDGLVRVICCTSTLAIGVNLPAHLVIIKNTVSWHSETKTFNELSDLEVMQMIGRAGRPQFDRRAIAILMTRQEKIARYETLIAGQETIESRLHHHLPEHMNAEINLGTIYDDSSAQQWLEGTFLYVRLKVNPQHYKLDGDDASQDPSVRVQRICARVLKTLDYNDLVLSGCRLRCTPQGEAMARYCVRLDTMAIFGALSQKARLSEILSAIAQAAEFATLHLRQNESPMYKELNESPLIKFRIPVNIALPSHKVSLIIQSTLGGIDPRSEKRFDGQGRQFGADVNTVFAHASRLIRCIIDCKVADRDAVAARNALELSRGLGARAWDDGFMQLTQIQDVGPVTCRKFSNCNINTIDDLLATQPHRLEMAMARNPPYGKTILDRARHFPQLRVMLKQTGSAKKSRSGDSINLRLKAEVAFINDMRPTRFAGKELFVCLLADTTDGSLAYFCRVPSKQLETVKDFPFEVFLSSPNQVVNCYASCDDIAGSQRHATFVPNLSADVFKGMHATTVVQSEALLQICGKRYGSVELRERHSPSEEDKGARESAFHDNILPLETYDFSNLLNVNARKDPHPNEPAGDLKPGQLPNGRWMCNHTCKDKDKCAHECCNIGTKHRPRKRPVAPGMQMPQMSDFFQKAGTSSQDLVITTERLSNEMDRRSPEARINEFCGSDLDSGRSHTARTYENIEEVDVTVAATSAAGNNLARNHSKSAAGHVSNKRPLKRARLESAAGVPHTISSLEYDLSDFSSMDNENAITPALTHELDPNTQAAACSDGTRKENAEVLREGAPKERIQLANNNEVEVGDPEIASGACVQSPIAAASIGVKDSSEKELQELAKWLRDNFGDVAELVQEGRVVRC